jgi:hypothetical protein
MQRPYAVRRQGEGKEYRGIWMRIGDERTSWRQGPESDVATMQQLRIRGRQGAPAEDLTAPGRTSRRSDGAGAQQPRI